MSLHARIFIEARIGYEHLQPRWWLIGELFHSGDVNVMSLLAHPWGEWEDDGDNPAPVVAPRGVPEDLSIQVRAAYGWSPVRRRSLDNSERQVLELEAKKRKYVPYMTRTTRGVLEDSGWLVDPSEWACSTWLTMAEVQRAQAKYLEIQGKPSVEIEGMLGLMRAYASGTPPSEVRAVLLFK